MNDDFAFPHLPPAPPSEPPEVPPWAEPPWDVVAAIVPDRRVLARTDDVAVMLSQIEVFPSGAKLQIRAVARWAPGMSDEEWHHLEARLHGRGPFGRGGMGDEFLRIGVRFADGRTATNLDVYDRMRRRRDGEPFAPSLVDAGGGGKGGHRNLTARRPVWLWPLPPPEQIDLFIEWPAVGIPLTRATLDGSAIAAAAARAEPIWPDAEGRPPAHAP